jgi:hypothetical protein
VSSEQRDQPSPEPTIRVLERARAESTQATYSEAAIDEVDVVGGGECVGNLGFLEIVEPTKTGFSGRLFLIFLLVAVAIHRGYCCYKTG